MGEVMSKIDYKSLIKYILITFIIGGLFTPFTMNTEFYKSLNKPFEIPSIVFPIVWSILYLLMAISLYMVKKEDSSENYLIYYIQLIVNSLWTLFFFGFKWYLFSFFWIILLIILVVAMIKKFYSIKPLAGYLNIPYFLWLIFAGYLNFMIYYLN